MKQALLILLLNTAFYNSLLSQNTPTIQWQKNLGGTLDDGFNCVKQTKDGGYIAVGSTKSNDSDVVGNHGDWDCWVVKLNNSGIIQWKKCYGGSNTEGGRYVEQTKDGGFIIVGGTNSNDGDVSGYFNGNISSYPDAWVLKIDSTGNKQWQKCYGGSNYDVAVEIHQTFNGGYIVVGYTESNDGTVVGHHQNSATADVWVLNLDSTGSVLWQKCLGGSSVDRGYSIIQTKDSGYILAGETYSNDGDVIGNHGDFDGWVVKLTNKGKIKWQKCYGGSGTEYISKIIESGVNEFVVCGASGGSVNGNLTGITTYGDGDYWVIKIDSIGNILWQKCYGGKNLEDATDIHLTNDGGFVITGISESDSVMTNQINHFHGGNDIWIVRVDSMGNLIWQTCFGGTYWESGQSVGQTSDGGYIICGNASSNDGDVAFHYGFITSYDGWIVKLKPVLLPLNLLNFVATKMNYEPLTQIGLTWRTSNEFNISHFNIQRSVNSKDFKTIGSLKPLNNLLILKEYTYVDNEITQLKETSTLFYRLEIMDNDGNKSYSEIRTVAIDKGKTPISIFPNPATCITNVQSEHIKQLTIFNRLGQIVSKQIVENLPIVRLNVSQFPKGAYIIEIVEKDGSKKLGKLVVE